VTGLPVAGAVYNIYNSGGTLVEIITTGPDGWVAVTLQNWGTYSVKEAKAPDGYLLDTNSYSVTFNAKNLYQVLYVKDTPITPTPTVTVAGLIEVLSFTGVPPVVPISGFSVIISGIALLAASLVRRRKK